MKTGNKVVLSFAIDEHEKNKLIEIAKKKGESLSAYVSNIVYNHSKKKYFPKGTKKAYSHRK